MQLSEQIYLNLYESHLQPVAPVDVNTNQVLARIYEEDITSPLEFDLFCQSFPQFNIKTVGRTPRGEDKHHFSYTCLHLAVVKKNATLVKHVISKFRKEILFQNDLSNNSIIARAVTLSSTEILEDLIDSGANVNTPHIHKLDLRVYTPLGMALHLNDEKAARMLLQAGAEEACNINKNGMQLLQNARSRPNHLRLKNAGLYDSVPLLAEQKSQPLVERTFSIERSLKRKLRAEIHAAAFQFFLGLGDSRSGIAVLPKELVARISKESKPSNTIRKKARTLLKEARYEICKNEMLFLCALQDSGSPIAMLNRDLILNIFKFRIQLEL